MKSLLTLLFCSFMLVSCIFLDEDNTPKPTQLSEIKPEVNPQLQWAVNTGSGVGNDSLRLEPALTEQAIITADKNGRVTSINKVNGQVNWQSPTQLSLTTGPGAGEGLVVVGSRKGEVFALSAATGKTVWKTRVDAEILANPVITRDKILIRTVDGHLFALSTQNGQKLWSYDQSEPALVLRGASLPKTRGNYGIVGFANGNLVKLSLAQGDVSWLQPVTFPHGSFSAQRMVDINADPFLMGDKIYVATFQGKLAALDWGSGKTLWSKDLSSYAGLVGDHSQIFVSDAKSIVWAFSANSGSNIWQQTQLEARNITGPAAIKGYVVVGDAEGYLHWLSQKDGHFAGRTKLASAAILTPPIVDGNKIYVINQKGYLAAYKLAG